jgi:hypothetical protein
LRIKVISQNQPYALPARRLSNFSINGKEIKNGAFTYSVLEYMGRPGEKRVNGLKAYVEMRVPEITNGQQQPTTKQETLETNWLIK